MRLISKNNKRNIYNYSLVFILSCIGFIIMNISAYGQEVIKKDSSTAKLDIQKTDTARARVTYNKTDSTSFQKDTAQSQRNDNSALEIGSSRGIFILSADRMLQLRIIGSVRANFNYSDQELDNHLTFNPYEVPTDVQSKSINFYAGLKETRLGFEVTRRTKKRGDIFIRIEGDFDSDETAFRIRHAYGQFGGLLVGQTWSLFNNVVFLPATVSNSGPAGVVKLRTPQIRYSRNINTKMSWSAAIEYSSPSLSSPDSLGGELLQVIPDFTGRFSYITDLISYRFAIVLSTISGRIDSSSLSYNFGFGASFAGKMKLKKNGELFLSVTAGSAMSHFLAVFNGQGEDMTFNPSTQKFVALNTIAGYIAYNHDLPKNLSASLSFGVAVISNKDFQLDNTYNKSYNALLNLFWKPIDGARIGVELANGQRVDKNGFRGMANRVSILIYYDF